MSDLTDFLLARIAEDEAVARAVWDSEWASLFDGTGGPLADYGDRHDPARVLAECEAKRRIVGMCVPSGVDDEGKDFYVGGYGEAYVEALGFLALPYADHPDYDEEWKP